MKQRLILSLVVPVGLLLALVEGPSQPAALAGSLESGIEPAKQPGVGLPAASTSDPALSLPTGASADWWLAVQEKIVKSEYYVTWQDGTYLVDLEAAYQAPNRANNLRTYFTAAGPIVIPRMGYKADDAPPWRWTARLVAWGRAGNMGPVPAARLAVQNNEIRYDRGTLTEWYLNDETGLEQGFALPSPPVTESGEHLQLELALGGSLSAQAGEEGAGIEFGEAGGRQVLAYGESRATDAQGRDLPVQLVLRGSTLILLIDDSQAIYPLDVTQTINGLPTSHNLAIDFPSTSQGGFSVATAGDVNGDGYSDAIVGAPYYDGGETDEGRAYVFYGSPIGLLLTGPWLKEIDQEGARFGYSVSTAGDVNGDGYSDVIVGAPRFEDSASQSDEGAFWVYRGSSGGLQSSPVSHEEGNQADALFGFSVSTAGDVNGDGYSDVIVGAPGFDAGQFGEGYAWVWLGTGTGLSDTPHWHAQIDEAYAEFGFSVSTAGDLNRDGYADVIIGAPGVTVEYSDEGAVFAWHGSQYGVNEGEDGTEINREWFFRSGSINARLGSSVATAGDVNGDGYSDVILGAPYHYWDGAEAGRIYLSLGGSNGLDDIGLWQVSYYGENPGDRFGFSVATAGDVNGDGYADVIVGAPHYVDDSSQKGRAYLWYGSSSGIGTDYDWDDIGVGTDALFGTSVATAGDINGDGYSDIIVGSPGYLSGGGRAYVYHGGPDNPSETADWTKISNLELALFGMSVGTAGDVNGDGYADIVVGSPRWDSGQDLEGAVWVYHGNAGLMDTAPDFYKQSNQVGAEFGTSVGTAGDVNGDGYDDIIVGSPFWDHDYTDEGAAWIYKGSSDGLVSAPLWHKVPDQAEAQFGASVGTAGDVNGDGYADVIVGAPYYHHPTTDEGMAWVYLGGDPAPSTTPQWDGEGNQSNAHYGQAVGTAGDVNGDGYSDIIVGAPDLDVDAINEGRAWVYHGSPHGVEDAYAWRQRGSVGNAQYGFAVGTAGDVNGDHYSDIIVGAPNWYDDVQGEGKAWVYHGSREGLSGTSSWSKEGGNLSWKYGYSVGTAGDVNGDGYADVIIGIQNSSEGELYEGGASLYYGSGTGLEDSRAWHGQSDKASAHYGESVGTAGDLNGDGYADLIVGAPHYRTNYFDEGKVFVYYGNGRPGIDMRPQQFKAIADAPIPHLGHSDMLDVFRLGVRGWTPYGRAWYRAEYEVKAFGVPFNGDGLRRSNWYDTEDGNAAHVTTLAGHMAGTQYHWRVRLRYDTAGVPFQQYSRWMHMPWNGWQEADLQTAGSWLALPLILNGDE
jgi:hypothetical protein